MVLIEHDAKLLLQRLPEGVKKEQIGELYPQVLEARVCGACRELFE